MNLSHKTELAAYSAGPFIRPTTYKTGLFLHHFLGAKRQSNNSIWEFQCSRRGQILLLRPRLGSVIRPFVYKTSAPSGLISGPALY